MKSLRPLFAGFALCIGAGTALPASAAIPAVDLAHRPSPAQSGNLHAGAFATGPGKDGDIHFYQAGFHEDGWHGSLKKYIVRISDDAPVIDPKALWDAGEILTGTHGVAAIPAPAARRIYTLRMDDSGVAATVEFQWSNLTLQQQKLLDASPVTGFADRLGEKRVEYLRGLRDLERGRAGGIFRARRGLLGDIVNGAPVYQGDPPAAQSSVDVRQGLPASRHYDHAVYVGANDGMLHAFHAGSGVELFAYIPNALIANLPQLTRPDYVRRPYVDGAITVAEAQIRGSPRTVLLAGMGGGAQGLIALDVTNPGEFAAGAGALWEFTDLDDPAMGNLMNRASIGKFRIGGTRSAAQFGYFAVVGNGMNSYVNDGARRYDSSGAGALFLLALDKSPTERWERNVNYYKLTAPIQDKAAANGLGPAALVVGAHGEVRHAYAGDLQGNLWRFDFGDDLSATGTKAAGVLIFTAKDSQGKRQPITTQPKVVFAPGGGHVVLFGTGKYFEAVDNSPGGFSTQSYYGIYDPLRKSYKVTGRSELSRRTVERQADTSLNIEGDEFVYGEGSGRKKGWYVDFPDSATTGERVIANAVLHAGQLVFTTLIPCAATCEAASGRSYTLLPLSGLPSASNRNGAIAPSDAYGIPVVVRRDRHSASRSQSASVPVPKRDIVVRAGAVGNAPVLIPVSAEANAPGEEVAPARRSGWREIVNWQELRDAAKK